MDNKMYNVTNRSGSQVVYSVPELNIRREFMPRETKKISFEELEKLSYRPGGQSLLINYLMVEEDVLEELNMGKQEPEYYYSEEDLIEIMKNGSTDKFLDTLDFATEGRIELIKDLAVKLPLTDTTKIKALEEKTGFDLMRALTELKEESSAGPEIAAPKRREAVTPAPQRRAAVAPPPASNSK